jgi:hypothetical protein
MIVANSIWEKITMGKTKYDWSQADLLLGTMPDSKLGRMFGIPTTSVYRRRRSRGIPAYGRRSGGDKYVDILGQIPDEAVARIAGVSVETARRWRRFRGIDEAGGAREQLVQQHLTHWLDCPYQEYVYTPRGVIDVLTDDAIYEVEYALSTARAHNAIGKLLALRQLRPGRKLVRACHKVTTSRRMIAAISGMGLEIIALDSTMPT